MKSILKMGVSLVLLLLITSTGFAQQTVESPDEVTQDDPQRIEMLRQKSGERPPAHIQTKEDPLLGLEAEDRAIEEEARRNKHNANAPVQKINTDDPYAGMAPEDRLVEETGIAPEMPEEPVVEQTIRVNEGRNSDGTLISEVGVTDIPYDPSNVSNEKNTVDASLRNADGTLISEVGVKDKKYVPATTEQGTVKDTRPRNADGTLK